MPFGHFGQKAVYFSPSWLYTAKFIQIGETFLTISKTKPIIGVFITLKDFDYQKTQKNMKKNIPIKERTTYGILYQNESGGRFFYEIQKYSHQPPHIKDYYFFSIPLRAICFDMSV